MIVLDSRASPIWLSRMFSVCAIVACALHSAGLIGCAAELHWRRAGSGDYRLVLSASRGNF